MFLCCKMYTVRIQFSTVQYMRRKVFLREREGGRGPEREGEENRKKEERKGEGEFDERERGSYHFC